MPRTRTSWKAGQTGNARGRPTHSLESLSHLLKRRLDEVPTEIAQAMLKGVAVEDRTWAELIVLKTLVDAVEGDGRARELVWNRLEGLAPQHLSIEAEGKVVCLLEELKANREANE